MVREFRSPRSRSVAAATTPQRLAREFDGALWREEPNGTLEVATMRDRRVERYLVHDDGTTTLIASQTPTALDRYAKKLAIGAWGLGLAGILVAGAGRVEVGVAMFFAAFALFGFFGIRAAKAGDLAARVEKWVPGKWQEPTDLHDWAPRSSEQLAAVEQIADEHDGVAFVREDGARIVEVRVRRRGELDVYWVDELGRSGLATTESRALHYHADRVLRILAWPAFLGAIVLLMSRHFVLAGVFAASFALVLIAGSRNDKRLSVEEHVKRIARDGRPWTEIRTRRVEDTDGG